MLFATNGRSATTKLICLATLVVTSVPTASGCIYGADACLAGDHIRPNLESAPLKILGAKLVRANGKKRAVVAAVRVENTTDRPIDAWRHCLVFYDAFEEVLEVTDRDCAVIAPRNVIRQCTKTAACFSGSRVIEPGERTTLRTPPLSGYSSAKTLDACIYAVHYQDNGETWERRILP